uniref:Orf c04009 protein n=1 Tax=Saccharolobus solfataricus TaxID=2287 RepID=P95948_SACSO|nr:orf c04009 [Saccharolobus solfataricus P2]
MLFCRPNAKAPLLYPSFFSLLNILTSKSGGIINVDNNLSKYSCSSSDTIIISNLFLSHIASCILSINPWITSIRSPFVGTIIDNLGRLLSLLSKIKFAISPLLPNIYKMI